VKRVLLNDFQKKKVMVLSRKTVMVLIVLFSMSGNFSSYLICFLSFKNINTTGFKTLEQGQEVEFTIVQGEKGLEARVSYFKIFE
jgi:hypothetical protein